MRVEDALVIGVAITLLAFGMLAAAGDDRLTALIASRGARALVMSRSPMPPPPAPPKPRDPCCNECRGTGRWRPDGNVLVSCPCDPSCPCKKGAKK